MRSFYNHSLTLLNCDKTLDEKFLHQLFKNNKNTPILVKNNDQYYIFGNIINGLNHVLGLTPVEKNDEKVFATLSFSQKAQTLHRGDPLLTSAIYSVLEKGHTPSFQVVKPKTPVKTWVIRIVIRIIFPPIIIWDLIKLAVNFLFGGLLSKLIFPAQNDSKWTRDSYNTWDQETIKRFAVEHENKLELQRFIVRTHDGAELDSIEITPKDAKATDHYLIPFYGNGENYESNLKEAAKNAETLKCKLITFNHRNVGLSTGALRASADLVTDGIAQVQRLLDLGVKPGKITLKGFSLGGAVSALVAAHFRARGIYINCFNDRSFSSFTNVVVGWIRTAENFNFVRNGHKESAFRKFLGYLAKPIIYFALAITKWEMDAESAFKKLPKTHRDYMVVRSSKKAIKEAAAAANNKDYHKDYIQKDRDNLETPRDLHIMEDATSILCSPTPAAIRAEYKKYKNCFIYDNRCGNLFLLDANGDDDVTDIFNSLLFRIINKKKLKTTLKAIMGNNTSKKMTKEELQNLFKDNVKDPKRPDNPPEIADDAVITHYSSMHMALKSERQKDKKAINQQTLQDITKDGKKFSTDIIKAKLKAARAPLTQRKMTPTTPGNAHMNYPATLIDRYQGKDGNVFFWDFYRKAQKHHDSVPANTVGYSYTP